MENPEFADPRLDALLSRLEGVKLQGDKYVAKCPAHGSHGRKLQVRQGRSGILLKCWSAGCSVDAIRRSLDLPWSALFWEGEHVKRKAMVMDRRGLELEAMMAAERLKGEQNVLATLRNERGWAAKALESLGVGWDGERLTIPVKDKDGKLHDVLRYDPLGPPRYKMLQGKGRSRIPFPRPEDVEGNVCWVVEGEGSVFSMKSIGLNAVSLPGSIGKGSGDVQRPGKFAGNGWHRAWAKRFAAFPRVILLGDCDQVGRTLMMTAAYDMKQEGIHATTLDLGFDDGFDVGDFLRLAKTGELRRQAKAMLLMLDATAMRQPERLPEAREELQWWHRWQTEGPIDWSQGTPDLEPIPVEVAPQPDVALTWGDVR